MDQLLETFKNLGPARLGMMLITFFGLIIFFIFIAMKSSAPAMNMLYTDLTTTDSTEIAAKLESADIAYTVTNDGKQISVPQKMLGKARMLLAAEGLPRQGNMGYEIFDKKDTFGTTSFQQNINQLRALEGELSRTISTIDSIKNARVHLVLPQRELFSRETKPASASVFLNLRNAAALGPEQIQAIQHLIASSVPQLKPTHIAVIDQNGNLLARGEDDGEAATARNSDDLRQKYETRLTRSVEDMVGRIVGYGKVRANVTAKLNFDVISKNSESYNPDGQVARSTQSITEEGIDNTGASNNGSVSVENNLPGLPAASGAADGVAGSKNNRTEEVTNFEISKTVENIIRESGDVEKLSIAVLVDGSYETDATVTKPEGAAEDWTAPRKYVPRAQEELDKIASLVKSAVGYDESRGDTVEVINMQFAENDIISVAAPQPTVMDFLSKPEVIGMAETLALSIVAVLIILLVLRPLATHFAAMSAKSAANSSTAQEEAALLMTGASQAQLAGPGGGGSLQPGELETMIDMSSVEGKVKASSVQKISELVTNHPNETVSVIRSWMSQES